MAYEKKMLITRIDSDRDYKKEIERIVIEYCGKKLTITPDFDGKIRINKIDQIGNNDYISVNPGSGNEILVG